MPGTASMSLTRHHCGTGGALSGQFASVVVVVTTVVVPTAVVVTVAVVAAPVTLTVLVVVAARSSSSSSSPRCDVNDALLVVVVAVAPSPLWRPSQSCLSPSWRRKSPQWWSPNTNTSRPRGPRRSARPWRRPSCPRTRRRTRCLVVVPVVLAEELRGGGDVDGHGVAVTVDDGERPVGTLGAARVVVADTVDRRHLAEHALVLAVVLIGVVGLRRDDEHCGRGDGRVGHVALGERQQADAHVGERRRRSRPSPRTRSPGRR